MSGEASAPRPHVPGWRTSEHWVVWGVILLSAWVAWRGPRTRFEPLAVSTLTGVFYTAARTILKSLSIAAKPQGIPMDIDATIDAFISKFVASRIPATAALQPECDAAITAAEALAHKALEVYAVKLIASKAPQLLSALQQAFPNAGL